MIRSEVTKKTCYERMQLISALGLEKFKDTKFLGVLAVFGGDFFDMHALHMNVST